MKVRYSQSEFRRRVADLDRQLRELERRVRNPVADREHIAESRRRYWNLCRRLDTAQPDDNGALQDDYEGLVDSIGRWIVRQDARAA